MTEIAGGRWDNFLRRLFPVKGAAISPAIGPELVPVIIAQPDGEELRALRGEKLWIGAVPQIAVAGQFQGALVRNPPDSTVLVVVQGWYVFTGGTATTLSLRDHGTTLHAGALQGNVRGPLRRDGRFRGESIATELYHVTDAVPGGNPDGMFRIDLGGGAVTEIPPVVLDPGAIYGIWGETLATAMYATLWGFERIIEPAENF